MERITGIHLKEVLPYFEAAGEIAKKATCHRAKCGTVIIKNDRIIGQGYNGPPLDQEENRTCDNVHDLSIKPKYDKTCCIHAEWRAILDALRNNGDKIQDSNLYFMRVDQEGNFTDAGQPYCTTCSRLALESGVGKFALWNSNGADFYGTQEYNLVSYSFFKEKENDLLK